MTVLIILLETIIPAFFLIFSERGGAVSFGLYEIKKSPTPLGWVMIVVFSLSVVFGMIYLGIRIINKLKLK